LSLFLFLISVGWIMLALELAVVFKTCIRLAVDLHVLEGRWPWAGQELPVPHVSLGALSYGLFYTGWNHLTGVHWLSSFWFYLSYWNVTDLAVSNEGGQVVCVCLPARKAVREISKGLQG
jgi:hypothetical protein